MPNNEWGDFQTPPELATLVVERFRTERWSRVLEPTCGTGNFLEAAGRLGPEEVVGLEVNEAYAVSASRHGRVIVRDVLWNNFGDVPWSADGPLLVVGNPPWVTNAQLSTLGSINLPRKSNLRGLKGLDASTGSSNFDIAEFIWLKLIVELAPERPTIALLCKTHVARNVLSYCHQFGVPVGNAELFRIDAKKWFGASVDACLFSISVGTAEVDYRCRVFDSLEEDRPSKEFGFVDGVMVADVEAYTRSRTADGRCPFEWRQGVKHDAASIMELREDSAGNLTNKKGELVEVEPDRLYPMLKATDVFKGTSDSRRMMILPQRSLGESTEGLATEAPNLWRYLKDHEADFAQRRSSIYLGRPPFAVFGIGPYTFAPYKVAISGLHKEPRFRLVPPVGGKPCVLDDTCYLLPFDDPVMAALTFVLLSSKEAQALLTSLAFWDAKRPVTKRLLQRLDLRAIAAACDVDAVATVAQRALESIGLFESVDWEKTVDAFTSPAESR